MAATAGSGANGVRSAPGTPSGVRLPGPPPLLLLQPSWEEGRVTRTHRGDPPKRPSLHLSPVTRGVQQTAEKLSREQVSSALLPRQTLALC